jgi:hypothetical protein
MKMLEEPPSTFALYRNPRRSSRCRFYRPLDWRSLAVPQISKSSGLAIRCKPFSIGSPRQRLCPTSHRLQLVNEL